jgi:hypothetical protein
MRATIYLQTVTKVAVHSASHGIEVATEWDGQAIAAYCDYYTSKK